MSRRYSIKNSQSMKSKLPASKLRKRLIKQCDDLVAQIVKARDGGCVICPTGNPRSPIRECGHLFSRRYMSLRFDFANTHEQCQYHNSLHRFDTHPYNSWFVNKFGAKAWDELYQKKSETKSYKVWELEELKGQLQAQLAILTP